jgi:hypothetical protein
VRSAHPRRLAASTGLFFDRDRLRIDCPRSGPGQVRGIFSGPGPGPPGSVQSLPGPGPGPHWTGSARAGPGLGQVQTRTWLIFSWNDSSFHNTCLAVVNTTSEIQEYISSHTYLQESSAQVTICGRIPRVYGSPYTPQHGSWVFQYPKAP